MGFHKRHIDKENIIAYYNRDGIEGLKKLFSADALIVHGDIDTNKIVEYLMDDDEISLSKLIVDLEVESDPFDDPDVQEFLEKADEQGPWDEEHDKVHTVGGLTNDKDKDFMKFQNKLKNLEEDDFDNQPFGD